MRLAIHHVTEFEYEGHVHESFNEARLHPTTDALQTCEAFELQTDPRVNISTYRDFYTNIVHYFEVPDPHSSLRVEARAIVETRGQGATIADGCPASHQAVRENYHEYLIGSPFVSLEPEIWRQAIDIAPRQGDVSADARALMAWVHAHMRYAPGTTHAQTRMIEAYRRREGVCQDFAHVLLALCRTIAIPARYVSGYLYQPPGTDDIPSADGATHAWIEVAIPGYGWWSLDPTHDRPADEQYVRIAVGRDYADIRPLSGTYRGGTTRRMQVHVNLEQIGGADALAPPGH